MEDRGKKGGRSSLCPWVVASAHIVSLPTLCPGTLTSEPFATQTVSLLEQAS